MTVGLLIFVMEDVVLGQVFLRVVPFSPVNIIPPKLHTHLHLRAKPATFIQKNFVSDIGEPSKG
jgi:hypothetical protein